MSATITLRVSERTLERLRRGERVLVRLGRSTVVAGVARRAGRRPGGNPTGGTITTRRAHVVLRRGRVHASQVLSQLAAAGLLRREKWARYAVTPKGLAARAKLSDVAIYRAGTHRRRLAEWAMERQRPFGVPEVSRLLGIARYSVHVVLRRLLRDRVIEREGPGVYRAR